MKTSRIVESSVDKYDIIHSLQKKEYLSYPLRPSIEKDVLKHISLYLCGISVNIGDLIKSKTLKVFFIEDGDDYKTPIVICEGNRPLVVLPNTDTESKIDTGNVFRCDYGGATRLHEIFTEYSISNPIIFDSNSGNEYLENLQSFFGKV